MLEMKNMNKIIIILAALTAFALEAAPIPLDIKKAVVFIYYLDNQTNISADGTGFLVYMPSATDTNKAFGYLVTARHVLRPATNNWLPGVFVRLNKKDGTSVQIPLPLITSGPNKNVFTHTDPTVDIAVVPFFPTPFTNFDCLFLPEELIPSVTDFKDLDIHEGSDVFFTGMFINHLGNKRNTPITRFGKVALMSDEKIDWVTGTTDLYLMEANSFPGNSGSPVYFQIGNERENGSIVLGGGPRIKLAGILSGGYLINQRVQIDSVSTNEYVSPFIGITGVIPSYELKDILDSKELKQQRGEP